MADKAMDNNKVTIVGTVDSEFTYSHEVFGEGFYMLEVVVSRLSHMEDRIPLMVSLWASSSFARRPSISISIAPIIPIIFDNILSFLF